MPMLMLKGLLTADKFKTKWTSPFQVPTFLTHEGLVPLCVPDACCMLFATVFLTHLCTSSRSVFCSIGRTFPIEQKRTVNQPLSFIHYLLHSFLLQELYLSFHCPCYNFFCMSYCTFYIHHYFCILIYYHNHTFSSCQILFQNPALEK